jgi:hypothetical protein
MPAHHRRIVDFTPRGRADPHKGIKLTHGDQRFNVN